MARTELSLSDSPQFPLDSTFQCFNEVGANGLWRDHVVNGANPLRPLDVVDVIELARYFAHLFGPYQCADLVQLDLKSGPLGIICLHNLLLQRLRAWVGFCPGIDFASEDDRSGRDSADNRGV